LDIQDIRREYIHAGLRRADLAADPIEQFSTWLDLAVMANLQDPTAMSVATATPSGQPSQRIVLLKHFDDKGFVFYTNLESRKAKEIADNNQVSMHFAWLALDRQVIAGGRVEKLSSAESFKYFASRPRDSQLAAWASQQSRRLTSRQVLESAFMKMKEKYSRGEIPLPSFWGGYRIIPHEIEFWQGRTNRMHDRFMYTKGEDNSWAIERLAP
jgi:pyridoxamine 5'-phosphate oxidase